MRVEPATSSGKVTGAARGEAAFGLRTIAGFEALKGALVLVVGLGLLDLIHRDVQEMAENLVRHLHLSPSAHYPRIFLALTARLSDAWLWALAFGSLAYASLRFAEAYGLWHSRRWAKWLGAASGAIYVPFEIAGIFKKVDGLRVGSLLVNLAIVIYLLQSLRRRTAVTRAATEG